MIDRINLSEVNDIVHSFEMSDILQYVKSTNKKQLAITGNRNVKIMLKCELNELQEALNTKLSPSQD